MTRTQKAGETNTGRISKQFGYLLLGAVSTFAPGIAMAQSASSEIVVTAQRREEKLSDVPISITSFNTEAMDTQGMRSIDDISRLTPTLRFQRTSGVAGNNGANISIRGVASDVGASTTAIYIDETPVQIRSVGYFSGNPYPRLFDLERVEVLKGPQGTLFGAGAQGGAVRFITPQPKFGDMTVYARGEIATTENGALSHELGVAVGGGISETLAFRLSAWDRKDGGYIDRILPQTTTVIDEDINNNRTQSARVALTWAPNDQLSITPSVYYQTFRSGGRNQFWEGPSDLEDRDYVSGITSSEPEEDEWYVAAVKGEYDFGKIDFVSNTSYFDRDDVQNLNYINYQSFLRTGNQFGVFANKDPQNSNTNLQTKQKNFVQEFRLQSFDDDQPIDWTVGLYFANTKQDFQNLTESGRRPGVISSGFPQYLGRYNLLEIVEAEDTQYAAYASLDWKITEKLKLTLAGRYTKVDFDFLNTRDGPVNSGVRTTREESISNKAFTPKFGLTYQLDEDNMLYASASKGFRPGGAQLPIDKLFCASDLASLGITDTPLDFGSDSLWSYEVGSKNSLSDGKVFLDVNAYHVEWKDIQQTVRMPRCGFTYVDNLGSATGNGIDFTLNVRPANFIMFGVNLGFNETQYDETIIGGNNVILKQKGDRIGGPKWTGSAFVEGNWTYTGDIDGYARADYTFQNEGISPNPAVFGYDPGLPGLPMSDYLAVRVGAKFGHADVSAFVNNVTNSNEAISRSNDGRGSLLSYRETYRPRTIGLTAILKY